MAGTTRQSRPRFGFGDEIGPDDAGTGSNRWPERLAVNLSLVETSLEPIREEQTEPSFFRLGNFRGEGVWTCHEARRIGASDASAAVEA